MNSISSFFFVFLLGGATCIDIKKRRIPNFLTMGGYLILTALRLVGTNSMTYYFISSALSFTVMVSISLFTGNKLGMGDAKLSISIGGVLGVYYWFISLLIASLAALLYVLPLLATQKMQKEDSIPFGPFLSLGAVIALWCKTRGI